MKLSPEPLNDPYHGDECSPSRLASNAKSLLASVRHLMSGHEIRTCEAYESGSFEDIDWDDRSDVIMRLANQFPKEISDHQLAEVLAHSRRVVAIHDRLTKRNPALAAS